MAAIHPRRWKSIHRDTGPGAKRKQSDMRFAGYPISLAVLSFALPAAAQVADLPDRGSDGGEAIVVTANRTAVPLERVGQSITVLVEQTIRESQRIGVPELLALTPGISLARNGGRGTVTSVFIRGAESGQSVVLYDGARLNDPSSTDSGASLADVTTANIERIEVLRGAQSTLYGSQAIGGVINIITAAPNAPFKADAQFEAGERDSYLARGALGGLRGDLAWRAGASYSATDGVSSYAPGTERDGYENVSLNGRIDYALAPGVALDLRGYYTRGEVEFDSFDSDAPFEGISDTWNGYAGLSFGLFDTLTNRLAYTRTDIERTNYDRSEVPGTLPVTFEAKGKTDRIEYQGTLNLPDGVLAVFGLDYAENELYTISYSSFVPDPVPAVGEDDTLGIYGQAQLAPFDGLTLTGGVRREEHSTFGGNTVGSASIAWSLNDGDTILRASWGEGFKAPSLYQIYSEYGNITLDPEEAESWDAGIEQRLFGAAVLSAVYFNRTSTDLIDFAFCSGAASNPLCADGRFGYYENVSRFEAEGVELAAALDFGALTGFANYTWLDTVNASPDAFNEGNRLPRRPENTFNFGAGYTFSSGLQAATDVRVVGASFSDPANTQRLDGYTLVDLRFSYPLDDRIELYGRVENLFDEDYQTIRDAGTLPQLFYAGVKLQL